MLKDSVSPAGVRLSTLELRYPAMIHPEFMTHRVFSRNAQSTRAIPVETMLRRIRDNPAAPVHWGKNQQGMQAEAELDEPEREKASVIWIEALEKMMVSVDELERLGVHKQVTNRLLQPWMHMTTIVTATEWENFFALRIHPQAQPEIKELAILMKSAMDESKPQVVQEGEWHLPLVNPAELESLSVEEAKKVSAGRCARVSYLTHLGTRDPAADIQLHDRLLINGHMSPFEHVATPLTKSDVFVGNFRGWKQYRKEIIHEDNFAALSGTVGGQ